MEYISVKEAAKKWGYSESTIRKWCNEDKIKVLFSAVKKNGRWYIPINAECPKILKIE